MEIHIGANSKISQFIASKSNKIIKISSKKKKNFIKVNYKKLFIFQKILNENKIKFIYFFIGENFKGKSEKKSLYVNYVLPLKILNYLLNSSKSKIKVIFFGTFLENEIKTSDNNLDYKKNKIALRQKIINLNKKKNFEFIWLKLPIIYGYKKMKPSFVNFIIKNLKSNKIIKIDYKFNTVSLLHINDLNRVLKKIKLNWKSYRNKIVSPNTEGPFYIFEFLEEIKKKYKIKNKIFFKNEKKREKLILKNKIIKIRLKENYLDFFKKYV